MALVESLKLTLGMKMPDFSLPDAHGRTVSSDTLVGEKGLLVGFMCNHCPYAQAVWPRLIRLAAWCRPLGVHTIAINPNIHPDYPEDAPQKMAEKEKLWGIGFPYLADEHQQTARAFRAQCTPDLYLFNASRGLVYHGRLDDNWKDPAKVKREELKEAVEALIAGKTASGIQHPSMGCSIKWKPEKGL